MKRIRDMVDSDRVLLLMYLSAPVAIAAVAFAMAVGLTAFGAPQVGTPRSTAAGLAYVYLTVGLMWLPAYLVACGWFWWATRDDEAQENLFKRLFTMPLVGAAFVWFPVLYFTPAPMAQKVRMYPLLALSAIVGGYIWVGLVRLMFRAWRKRI